MQGLPANTTPSLCCQNKELTEAYNSKTLLDLNLHTGFSLSVGPVPSSLGLQAAQRCVCCACPGKSSPAARPGCGLAMLGQPTSLRPLLRPPLQGYDLSEEPDYWPPVIETPEGRRIVTGEQELQA